MNGEIIESQCGIIQIVSGPCNCREDTPTPAPTAGAVETTPQPTSPSEPTMPSPSTPSTPEPTNPPILTTGPPVELNDPECINSITAGKEDNALVELLIKIQFDMDPMETGWYIADSLYQCFRVGVPALTYRDDLQSVEERVLVVGGIEYMFVIEDAAGNGMTAGSRQGSYTVSHNDVVLVAGGGDFGSEQQTFFTAPER
jgi:hypothetical protein